MVTSHRRLFFIRDFIKAYRQLVAHQKGQVSPEVIVAEPLKDAQLAELSDTLKSFTGGKEVDLAVKIDRAIIGGFVVRVGSRMFDTSLRTKLNSIKLVMKGVS
jgi:F-type H+-transporting ATPase subunit delta